MPPTPAAPLPGPTRPFEGPARLDIPLDAPGRHLGAMRLPHSHDGSAYGQIVVPVAVVHGGSGPTILLTAGVHGDEYEGQIVLRALARELDPAAVHGRVIIVPTANPAASVSGRRTSPIDGGNLARLFPGDPGGLPTSQIAEGIARLLLPQADWLLDLHSGGSTLEYVPCAFGRLPADAGQARRVLDLLLAFGAPVAAVVRRPEASGTLVAAALDQGAIAMAAELGGGGGVTDATLAIAARGVRNVLAHAGLLKDVRTEASPRPRLAGIEPAHFVRSPGRGLFEPAVSLGDAVKAGDTAGRLWDPERLDRPPEVIRFTHGGWAICRRVPAMAAPGDVLVHLAEDVTAAELLNR